MKKFNNSNVLAIIIFAVGLIATVVFAGILTNNTDTARDSIAGSEAQIADLAAEYSDLAAYNGLTVTGDRVKEFIDENAKEVPVFVTTKALAAAADNNRHQYAVSGNKVTDKGADTTMPEATAGDKGQYKGAVTHVTDVKKDGYINPSASFKCEICKNENGIVTAVLFTQV